jgi:ribosomal-protein-alanine N-acetyltransferase
VADLAQVQYIENASFKDPYSPLTFWAMYAHPKTIFRVAASRKRVIGYSILKLEKRDKTTIGHIISIAIDPEFRRRAIGSRLLEDILSAVRTIPPPASYLELEVRTDNDIAIALYTKYGFRIVCRIPDYYGRGSDALVMNIELKKT